MTDEVLVWSVWILERGADCLHIAAAALVDVLDILENLDFAQQRVSM